jgi:small subunit ribosomal protein S4e
MRSHLKRLAAPKTWEIKRKSTTYIAWSRPTGHSLRQSLPVVVVIRDMLGFAKTAKEAKYILREKTVLVNGTKITDFKRGMGLMDVIEFPETGVVFRLLYNKHGMLSLVKQGKNEAQQRLCRIMGKTSVKGGKLQLNLSGGANMLVDKGDYNTGDVVVLDQKNKILEHLKLEKGMLVYFTGGKNIGHTGVVDSIQGSRLLFKKDKETFETLKKFAFVVGKDKPLIGMGVGQDEQ